MTKSARVAFCLAFAVACGRVDPGGAPGAAGMESEQSNDSPMALLPWQVGSSWTYRVTRGDQVSEKTTTVGPVEAVGGISVNAELLANLVTTREIDGSYTESWQGPLGSNLERILRFRERDYDRDSNALEQETTYYEPGKLHADGSPEHSLKGASWVDAYSGTWMNVGDPPAPFTKEEVWTVLDDNETVTVPAGTFKGVVHLQKEGDRLKDYWYARGVGKLQEQGMQLEELVSYHLEP